MSLFKTAFCIMTSACLISQAVAQTVYDGDRVDVTANGTLIGAIQAGSDVNYGAESNDSNFEGAVEIGGGFTYQLGDGQVYGNVSIVAAFQRLDGTLGGSDPNSGVNGFSTVLGDGTESDFDTEQVHIGFSNDLFDVSVGAQDFVIGDGFLLADGVFDTGPVQGTYWAAPHTAWRNAAIFKLNTNPVRADVFWLRADVNSFRQEYAGINVEYLLPEAGGTFGITYFEVIDDDKSGDGNGPGSGAQTINSGNNGAQYFDIRANSIALPFVENVTLHGEYAHIFGEHDESNLEYDANAWYVEGNYTFANSAWAPVLTYRYASHSGDDLATPENEGFAVPNYGIGRDWDTWFQGEITGEYHLFNNNQNTHLVKLKVYPHEHWAFAVYYLNFTLDEEHFLGGAVNSDEWADEINVTAEYYPSDNLYLFGALAWATPGDAAKAANAYGNDEDAFLAEIYASYSF